jgi:capsular polysaccharide biosynthesis protein
VELRAYWAIIMRRFWIIALVFGVVLLYVGYQYYSTHKTSNASKVYLSTVVLRVALQANNRNTDQNYADYVTASETLADEFVTGPILTSDDFGTQVVQQIKNDSGIITQKFGADTDLSSLNDPTAITAALKPTRAHALVQIDVDWSTEAGAWAIAHAVGEVSQQVAPHYLDYEVRGSNALTNATQPTAAAEVVSDATTPKIDPTAGGNKTTLLLALLVVGLIIGTALAFLIEYLDDRIHNTDDVAKLLQLPVYGEVPRPPTPGRSRSPRIAVR